jgi:hypothetical protein
LDRVHVRVHAQPDRCIPVPPAPSTLVRAHMPWSADVRRRAGM